MQTKLLTLPSLLLITLGCTSQGQPLTQVPAAREASRPEEKSLKEVGSVPEAPLARASLLESTDATDAPTAEGEVVSNAPLFKFEWLQVRALGPGPWAQSPSNPNARINLGESFKAEINLGEAFKKIASFDVGYGYLEEVAISADGKFAGVISTDSGLFTVYDVDAKKKLSEVRYPGFAQFDELTLARAWDGRFLLGGKSGLYAGTFGDETLSLLREGSFTELYSYPEDAFLFGVERRIEPQSGFGSLTVSPPDEAEWIAGEFTFAQRPDGIAFAERGELLAVSYYPANTVYLYDLVHEKTLRSFASPEYAGSVAMTRDGKYIAIGGAQLWVYDTTSGERIFDDAKYGNNIDTVLFSPDERLLVTSAYEGKIRVYPFDRSATIPLKKKPQVLRHRGTANVYGLAFSADGRRLASASGDKSLIVWERSTR